jgi:general secretion pathway protein K
MSVFKRKQPHSQQGAALLMALIIVTLVSTLAASMVWQQWRATQVESAERARSQSAWILTGALDWAGVILKEDAKSGNMVDHLGEPWAVPLAEARLSTFLAVDVSNAEDAPDTFLSGTITDAQGRYNLRNLLDAKAEIIPTELQTLQRLCVNLNLAASIANRIAQGLQSAKAAGMPTPPPGANIENASLMPDRVEQLSWLGIEAESLKRLEPHIVLLPAATPVNINTASREVLASVFLKLDLGSAERLVKIRERAPFENMPSVAAQFPPGTVLPSPTQLGVSSNYFFVRGRVRLSNQILEQRSLVQRQRNRVKVLTREWVSSSETG